MNKRHIHAGFTLIEIIIYVALTAVVVVTSTRVMLSMVVAREKTEVKTDVQQDLRFAMDRMVNVILDATAINGGGSTFNDDNGILSLDMSGSSLDPTVFFLSNNRIRIQEGASEALPITSSGVLVDQLRFLDLSAADTFGTVKVRIHATDAVAGLDKTYDDDMTLETSVSLRQ